ncbi:hypothetical protein [Marixanthomonas spongiae]|jgi:hypothetical protein|uniref:Uncharacterized protein n=1 Tax=Marixanthomonas spongiae TaxID=2174845 RepID=A0A2U0HT05_9FLAO|nr:hypothetical protein [Marixanthomonas spongiae]PVW12001.1 hypothetical protein DDV96_15395 [Marixanthomonas spongiae]|tara:strand:- start:75955 stop:78285 length:2331 start_codon:yes stop_codon:yes gene_type:complete
MQNFYIYKYNYKEVKKLTTKIISTTVIFCDNTKINKSKLIEEIGRFYEKYSQTDKIFVIGGNYLKEELIKVFETDKEKTFKLIPKRDETSLFDNIYINVFDDKGVIKSVNDKVIPKKFKDGFLNEGLQNIFIKRGGLVETEGTHHYVFPSGKHCDKFLRTGNILLRSCEIYFIAFSMLKYLDEKKHNQIYCDTSSINSLALALSSLKNRFISDRIFQIPVESFSSYKGLYENKVNYKNNALLLISASTSGNILDYINDKHKEIKRSNIVVIFYLDLKAKYTDIKDNVLCNLTHDNNTNPNGIKAYDSYDSGNCKFCDSGSYPVEVSGDVFLLEKPKINPILIRIKDANTKLSSFVQQFMSVRKGNTVLRANYKEGSETSNKYDIYIDYSEILRGIKEKNERYSRYHKKLNAYIDQFVPSNTRFLIHLNDNSSKELAYYILDKIKINYTKSSLPQIISQDDFPEKISKQEVGSVLVVGSCISNGKNLLYLSRALRNYEGLRIVYFVGITRINNAALHKELKSNLKQGMYGPETSTYIEVENIFCANLSKNNNWQQETEFLKKMLTLLKDEDFDSKSIKYFEDRKNTINQSYSKDVKGLADNLFFPLINGNSNGLAIRNNFAFFNFDNYVNQVTQSDIYFTFNNVINSLRNSNNIEQSLKQTSFVRNLLSPNNFNRFNDGIIQASILRSAYPEELSYSIDFNISLEMKNILETLIKYHQEEQGEALLEFLYAIAIGKLSLKKEHLLEVLKLLKKNTESKIINSFTLYIEKVLMTKLYK